MKGLFFLIILSLFIGTPAFADCGCPSGKKEECSCANCDCKHCECEDASECTCGDDCECELCKGE